MYVVCVCFWKFKREKSTRRSIHKQDPKICVYVKNCILRSSNAEFRMIGDEWVGKLKVYSSKFREIIKVNTRILYTSLLCQQIFVYKQCVPFIKSRPLCRTFFEYKQCVFLNKITFLIIKIKKKLV